MKKIFLLTAAVLFFWGCSSTPKKTSSQWQISSKDKVTILLPAPGKDKLLDGHLKQAALMLQKALFHRTGARAAILQENKKLPNGKIISLGKTKLLARAGLSTAKMLAFEALISVRNNTLFIAGDDRKCLSFPYRPAPADHRAYILSTSRGAVVFAEKFLDTRFLLPGELGTDYARKRSTLTLPGDLDIRSKTSFQYMPARNYTGLYHLANQDCGSGVYKTTGGHSYYDSVPKEKYAKSNPEYFAELHGLRDSRANHLCISNPAVQKLLGDYLIAQFDKGIEVVELGQTDGYKPCTCVKCKALYGTDDFNEKLWILHRDVAARVYKERPKGKVMIISYGPTAAPPKTFKEFPPNVMIELCRTAPESIDQWKNYIVPQGFTAYLYNWGVYNPQGFTPKRSIKYVAAQLAKLRELPLHGIYRCGFGELFGMEGPVYYIFGKLIEDGTRDPKALFDEFIRRTYHESAIPMGTFFDLQESRLELYERRAEQDPRILIAATWPHNVLNRMEIALSQAEKMARTPKVKARIQLVRYEFDYMRNLAEIFHLHAAYESCRTPAIFNELCKKIDARNALIKSRMTARNRSKNIPGWGPRVTYFSFYDKTTVTANGTLRAVVGAPLNWDTALMRKYKILPGKKFKEIRIPKVKKVPGLGFDQGVWKNIKAHKMQGLQLEKLRDTARFKAAYDDKALYVIYSSPIDPGKKFIDFKHDGPVWGQDSVELFVDPTASTQRYFHFIAGPGTPSMYEAATGIITDIYHPLFNKIDSSWQGKWYKKARIRNNVMEIMMTIPFATVQSASPAPGTVWRGNWTRCRYFGKEIGGELSSWSPNFENISFHNPQAFGKLIFE